MIASRTAVAVLAMAVLSASACTGGGARSDGHDSSAAQGHDSSQVPSERGAASGSSDSVDVFAPPATPTRPGASGIERYPAATLATIGDALAHSPTTGRTIGGHATYHYVASRRVTSGGPEVHLHWVDVVFVQAGHATLLTGGRVDGGRTVAPGEVRGGQIAGGAPQSIGPGDLLVIPAGVPHQYQLARGDSIRYLTVKIASE